MDQGTNDPLYRREMCLLVLQQKGQKNKCDSGKKYVLVRRLKGVLSSKKPQLKEGRKEGRFILNG